MAAAAVLRLFLQGREGRFRQHVPGAAEDRVMASGFTGPALQLAYQLVRNNGGVTMPGTGIKDIDGLQLHQDADHQRREWRLQRIGWAVMALILLAALLGLFGHGPMSRARAGGGNGPTVEYERFARSQSPQQLKVSLPASMLAAGTVRLRLNRDFVENVEIRDIYPQPQSVAVGAGVFTYELKTTPGTWSADYMLIFEPQSFGPLSITIQAADAPPVTVTEWVYP